MKKGGVEGWLRGKFPEPSQEEYEAYANVVLEHRKARKKFYEDTEKLRNKDA